MVESLIEVPKLEPFCGDFGHLTTILDLDGVLCEFGENNTTYKNIERLVALKRIAVNSDLMIIDSSRIRVSSENYPQGKNVTHFPFYNQDSENFLRDIIHRFNPNCGVDFRVSFFRKRRKRYGEEMEELVREILELGRKVVFIGSNRNDIDVAKKIVTNIDDSERNKIHIFNTGHRLI